MASKVVWDGLQELYAQLRVLPKELHQEALNIGRTHANAAHFEIKGAYPVRTGNLRDGMDLEEAHTVYGMAFVLVNRAPHASVFEMGSEARHTKIGADRGSMPPGNVFVPRVIKWRRAMYAELAAMLERHGLRTSGNVAA